MALVACASDPPNPYEGYQLTVCVRSAVALDRLQVYYDKTGGLLPNTPPPTAGELAADRAPAEWLDVLAIDIVDIAPPADTVTYFNRGYGPRFVAILGLQNASGTLTTVNGGVLSRIGYLDGHDSDPIPTAIASEHLDLAPL